MILGISLPQYRPLRCEDCGQFVTHDDAVGEPGYQWHSDAASWEPIIRIVHRKHVRPEGEDTPKLPSISPEEYHENEGQI